MQQPPIRDDLLHKLHRIAAAYEMDATKMLNHIVAVALDELDGKQDDYTVCIPVWSEEPRREPEYTRAPQPPAHTCAFAGLLGDCVFALEVLLASPDLTLDCLEQATRDAIEVARETLDTVKKALDVHDAQQGKEHA